MSKQIMSKKTRLPAEVRAYLASIGSRGGIAKGKAKRRGDAAHYADLARKRWQRPAAPGK